MVAIFVKGITQAIKSLLFLLTQDKMKNIYQNRYELLIKKFIDAFILNNFGWQKVSDTKSYLYQLN